MSFRIQIEVKRSNTAGDYDDNGKWVAGEIKTFVINASVQPLSIKETESLPDGRRSENLVKLYTDTELYPELQATQSQQARKADKVIWNGKTWKVISCLPYQMNVISHYKATLKEVAEGA